jgi:hypothetical protein
VLGVLDDGDALSQSLSQSGRVTLARGGRAKQATPRLWLGWADIWQILACLCETCQSKERKKERKKASKNGGLLEADEADDDGLGRERMA